MDFAHYTDDPVHLAVELVNTFGWTSGTEHLQTVEDVAAFLDEHAGIWGGDLPSATAPDLAGIRGVRQTLHSIFEANDAQAASGIINGMLSEYGAVPSLSTHGDAPHLHFEARDGSLTDWLAVVTAMGLATVIADRGFERLGICHSEECRDVYVDTSRNRSRLHCSDTCRVRENVAAHRQRRRSDG